MRMKIVECNGVKPITDQEAMDAILSAIDSGTGTYSVDITFDVSTVLPPMPPRSVTHHKWQPDTGIRDGGVAAAPSFAGSACADPTAAAEPEPLGSADFPPGSFVAAHGLSAIDRELNGQGGRVVRTAGDLVVVDFGVRYGDQFMRPANIRRTPPRGPATG
eukprot:gene17782-6436_t